MSTYQWSEPNHLVVLVSPSTCVVRSLVYHGGVEVSTIVKDGKLLSRLRFINAEVLSDASDIHAGRDRV